jgi:glycosyltransferase involved in cell wall biosynthesis
MNGPLVSIVIPYYIHEEYLEAAVNSILNQTYKNLEVVVVFDPGKSRPPEEVLKNLPQDRLRYITQAEKSTAPNARNVGVKGSSGELILPMDADDLLHETYLEKTVGLMLKEPELAGVYTAVKMFGDRDEVYDPEWSVKGIVTGTGGALICLLYRRELFDSVGGYNPRWRVGDDSDFFLKACRKGFKIARLSEPLYLYRRHPASTTARSPQRDLMEMAIQVAQDHPDVMMEYLEDIIRYKEERYCKLEEEYSHLHREFHKLLEQYNQLEAGLQSAQADPTLLSRLKAGVKKMIT